MSTIDEARETLLRALEALEAAEGDLAGSSERADLVVVYSIGRRCADVGDWEEIGGWACTPGPKWAHVALMRRAADAQEDAVRAVDDDDDEG